MASPYGHALVGLGLFNLFYPRLVASRINTWVLYGLVIVVALAPDLDFLPGLFLGNLSRFHHGPFHSLGTAVGLCLTIGLLMKIKQRIQGAQGSRTAGGVKGMELKTLEPLNPGILDPYFYFKTSGFVFILICFHLFLDFFTEDLKPPLGFPLFWPFSEAYFISPWPILPHVERNFSNPAIWSQILRVFLVESLIILPFFFYSLKRKACRKKSG